MYVWEFNQRMGNFMKNFVKNRGLLFAYNHNKILSLVSFSLLYCDGGFNLLKNKGLTRYTNSITYGTLHFVNYYNIISDSNNITAKYITHYYINSGETSDFYLNKTNISLYSSYVPISSSLCVSLEIVSSGNFSSSLAKKFSKHSKSFSIEKSFNRHIHGSNFPGKMVWASIYDEPEKSQVLIIIVINNYIK